MTRLGVVAGAGALPGQIISACRQSGRDFHVLAFEESANPAAIAGAETTWIRMGALGKALTAARKEGIEELVFVGKIPRPSVMELMRDPRSARFMAKIGMRMLGDDNILSAVIRELENAEGFRVVAPEDLLNDILAMEGCYGALEPDGDCRSDIERGMAVADAIGSFDIGQAVVIQNGTVLGVEGVEGTDRLMDRCAEFVRPDAPGGVLVKAAKPGQERRIDLPVIGVTTVRCAARAGLRGVAVAAGSALVAERSAMAAAADAAGLFVVGVSGRRECPR